MEQKELPQRKQLRLTKYDYSQPGYYFVTICTAVRHQDILSVISPAVGAIINRPPAEVSLTSLGHLTRQAILEIPNRYPGISVDAYVIMPDHVHLILAVQNVGPDGRQIAAPTSISTVIQQLKRAVSRSAGQALWQKSFYDHVIRNETDLAETRRYIRVNPAALSVREKGDQP